MRLTIDNKRAKSMARTLEARVNANPKARLRYNQALDAVAAMLGFADANALAARTGHTIPDLGQDSPDALDTRARKAHARVEAASEDWHFALAQDAGSDRADAAAADLDAQAETLVAVAREVRRRQRRRHAQIPAETLARTLRRCAMALRDAPAPWRARLPEVTGESPDGAAPRDLLPSAKRRALTRAAALLNPVLPEEFDASVDPDKPRLALMFDDGHEPVQYFVEPRMTASGLRFRAVIDSRIEGFDGLLSVEEVQWAELDDTGDLMAAVDAILERADAELSLSDGQEDEDLAELRVALASVFEDAAGPVPDEAPEAPAAHRSEPCADAGTGRRLWRVAPHRVLREDTALLVRADDRAGAERAALEHAEACCAELDWDCYDASYWLDPQEHIVPACAGCGAAVERDGDSFCSAGCAQSHAGNR